MSSSPIRLLEDIQGSMLLPRPGRVE
jgi:hypothetical protein